MNLVAALGNPTPKYEDTRHNVGFMVLDYFLADSATFKQKFQSLFTIQDNTIFLKPQTYMNLSGNAIREAVAFYKVQRILVIHDDLDLEFGSLRFKFGGGSGGHNGLKSIDSNIGSDYFRLRIGISHPRNAKMTENAIDSTPNGLKVKDYVLEKFSTSEMESLKIVFETTSKAICDFVNGANLAELQNKYTRKGRWFDGDKKAAESIKLDNIANLDNPKNIANATNLDNPTILATSTQDSNKSKNASPKDSSQDCSTDTITDSSQDVAKDYLTKDSKNAQSAQNASRIITNYKSQANHAHKAK